VSKLKVFMKVQGRYAESHKARMSRMIEAGCWFCGAKVKAVGERKVVCLRCGAGYEWEIIPDGDRMVECRISGIKREEKGDA